MKAKKDDELKVIAQVIGMLASMTDDQAKRVLGYVAERLSEMRNREIVIDLDEVRV